MIPWEIHAIQVTNCNCDYGCPCQFNALPTYGTCEAAEGIKINKGFYDDVSLDGLTVAMIAKWSGPIHEGNGARQIIADVDLRTGRVMVEDVFELKVEPIKNPVSGEPHRVRIDIPNGFEFTLAEMASGTTKTQGIINLPNNNQSYSHLTELHWNNSGLIRS